MEPQLFVAIVVTGCFYALLGLAYFLIFRSTTNLNFAIGGYAMFAALAAAYLSAERGLQLAFVIPIAAAATVLLALLGEIVVGRRKAVGELGAVMAIVAYLFVIQQVAGILFGRAARQGPGVFPGASIQLLGVIVPADTVLEIAVTGVFFFVVWVWLIRGRYGRMLRAVGDNASAARRLGVPVERVRILAVGLAGVSAAVGGLFVGPLAGLTSEAGLAYSLYGFTAAVLGGFGSAWGPLIGGMALSILQVEAVRYLGSPYLDYVTLLVVLLILKLRPTGMLA